MTENLPKSMTDTKPQIQEAQRTLSRIILMTKIKQQENTPRHIFKCKKTKDKEKILKKARGKNPTLPIEVQA